MPTVKTAILKIDESGLLATATSVDAHGQPVESVVAITQEPHEQLSHAGHRAVFRALRQLREHLGLKELHWDWAP